MYKVKCKTCNELKYRQETKMIIEKPSKQYVSFCESFNLNYKNNVHFKCLKKCKHSWFMGIPDNEAKQILKDILKSLDTKTII